jgi:hypothetical protein
MASNPIRVLDVQYNHLTTVHSLDLSHTVILNLAHNDLATLWDKAKESTSLALKVATGDSMERVPDLSSLAVLNVSFNRLRCLPTAVGNAGRLQQLYVANNRLEDLPSSIGSLPLVDLFVSENCLRCAPARSREIRLFSLYASDILQALICVHVTVYRPLPAGVFSSTPAACGALLSHTCSKFP